jgi:hypothetical protein
MNRTNQTQMNTKASKTFSGNGKTLTAPPAKNPIKRYLNTRGAFISSHNFHSTTAGR